MIWKKSIWELLSEKIMKTIILNEWTLLKRNPWFIGLIAVLISIVGLISYFGVAETKKLIAMEAEASAEIRSQWDNQEAGNPHSAAHYGTYLFKPSSALTGFDEGVNGVVGKTLYLEGHRQNEIQYSEASQSLQISRFGKLRPALLLQLILPLLLIFLVFSAIRTERESDRFRILLVQGGDFRQILFGKIMAYWLLSVLFLIVTLSLQLILQSEKLTNDVILRTCLIGMGYAAFYWIVVCLTTYLSANLRQAGTALSLMLACWILWGVFLPKISGTIAEQLYQLPTRQEFSEGMTADRKDGLDGHNPEEEKLAVLKDSVLQKYQVETVEELPVNFDGILMQADEEIGNVVWDKHFGNLHEVLRQQKAFTQVSSIPNPLQSLQSLSMGLSGTDYFHHADFMLKAEEYRRAFIKELNDKHAYGGSKTGDWEWAADQEFYRSLEDFTYSSIPLDQVFSILWSDVLILFGWVVGGFLLITTSKFRI
jgi:ABC-2 type transport system permease protein